MTKATRTLEMNPRLIMLIGCWAVALWCAPLSAAESDAKGLQFFEEKIRPVLVDNCYKCHSADAEKVGKLKGGLLLDTRDAIL